MKPILLMAATSLCTLGSFAQTAVKTNLLYDATTSPNIGVEIGIAPLQTINLTYGLNPWTFKDKDGDERKAKHWAVQPEWRWWTCSRFNGHFFGVHAMGGEFNAAKASIPIPGFFFSGGNLRDIVKDRRAEGSFAGAGLTYGYQYIASRHVNIEAEIGLGYIHAWYDEYACGKCGGKTGSGGTNYAGVTKLGLSVMYIF